MPDLCSAETAVPVIDPQVRGRRGGAIISAGRGCRPRPAGPAPDNALLKYAQNRYIYCDHKSGRCAMTRKDKAFLASYDPAAYERPSVTVDLVLLSVLDGALHALLMRRTQPPAAGRWALPGGFVRMDESLDEAARRALHEKAHIASAFLEQLYTFGAVERDP